MQITQSRDCVRVLRNLEIGMQSQDSENAQRNLEIAQILRLRGTYPLAIPYAPSEISIGKSGCLGNM